MSFLFLKPTSEPTYYRHDTKLAQMLLSGDEQVSQIAFTELSSKYLDILADQSCLQLLDDSYYTKTLNGAFAALESIAVAYPYQHTDGWILNELIEVLKGLANDFLKLQKS